MADDQDIQTKKRGKGKADPAVQTGASQTPEGGQLGDESSAVTEPVPGALEEQIGRLGAAVTRETGYDLSEEAHRSAIERAEEAASDWEFDPAMLVSDGRDFLLEQIKRRPRPWDGSSPSEQRDIAAACEHAAQELVRKIAEAIAARGQEPVRVLLDKIALGESIQITGKVKTFSADEEDRAVMILHHARGKYVMVTVASKDDFQTGERPAPGVPEESPALPFEAGADEFEAALGAEHLAGRGDDELEPAVGSQTVLWRTGDKIDLVNQGLCDVRVNLKSGMVEALAPGEDPETSPWIDVQEATPDELAAEGDRIANFESGGGGQAQQPLDA